jgi:hypothetical protein
MMNKTETKDHSEQEQYLETEAENVLGAAGYVNDGSGKWIPLESHDPAQSTDDAWSRNE